MSRVLLTIMLMLCYVPYLKTPEFKVLVVVTLNIENGAIQIYPTYYTQGNTTVERNSSSNQYVITKSVNNANGILNAYDDGSNVTYNLVFCNLSVSLGIWCGVIGFGGDGRGTSANMTVNLHLEGTNNV